MRRTTRTTLTLAVAATLAVPAAVAPAVAAPASAGAAAAGATAGAASASSAGTANAASGSAADAALVRREAAKAARVAVPKLAWKSCGTDPALAKFQCTSVEVPTDYDRPRGGTTTIALTRLPASGQRIGSLFTNPGGPGGPGVSFVQQAAEIAYTPEVRAKFDIIGFDPRGVGQSDPVTCFPTAAEENAAFAGIPPFPVGAEQTKTFTRAMLRAAVGCMTTSPDRLTHYSTANVARDMDLLRRAVGDSKLSYVGYSYGTYLGATYAKLFPGNVRALVLDGTLSPEWYSGSDGDRRPLGVRLRQGEGSYDTYQQFLAECKKAGAAKCALAALGDPATVSEKLLQQLKAKPVEVPLPDGTTLTVDYQTALFVIFQNLYSPLAWTDLATTLASLVTPAPAARTAASPVAAKVLGEWNRRQEEYSGLGAALQPCIEAAQSGRPLAYPQFAADANRRAPHFGALRAWVGLPCEFMPVRDTDAFRGPWNLSVKSPVLVFGTRHDPATPYQTTRPYADLYPDARMVTVEGFGHATIGLSACVDQKITNYLVNLKAPADNSSCTQDHKPFTPLTKSRAAAAESALDLAAFTS
ncbi:alpha/beta hydrolase [Kribbella sp. NPDC051770]|uniref:alpha/beta hydrolase n=1 Tax=Kribbella sp. NPDC051770 TaxID=3155413 RepID=UPI003432F56A